MMKPADIVSASVLWDATQMAGINTAWNALDGTGIVVAVADTGLDNGINNTNMHPDFRDHIQGIHSYGISPDTQPFANTPYNDGASDLDTLDMELTLLVQFLVTAHNHLEQSREWLLRLSYTCKRLKSTLTGQHLQRIPTVLQTATN